MLATRSVSQVLTRTTTAVRAAATRATAVRTTARVAASPFSSYPQNSRAASIASRRRRRRQQHYSHQTCRHLSSTPAPSVPPPPGTEEADIYDVVCVGGGPAGLSLLTALRSNPATSSLRLALIESQDISKSLSWSLPPTQYSNRASSLTPASVAYLRRIGAWQHMAHDRLQPFQEMQVWDGISGARIEFNWPNQPQHGTIAWMNENANLVKGLLARLEELGGVATFDKANIESITLGPGAVAITADADDSLDLSSWPHISLSGDRKLAARLLIGADGANSPVRTFAGIPAKGWDYGRHAVVATLRMENEPDSYRTAYQRFLPTGPVALLPLPGPYATLVWSTLPERAALLKSLSPQDFVCMVNAAFRLSPVDLSYMHGITHGQADEFAWRAEHVPQPQPQEDLEIPGPVAAVQEGSVAAFPLRMRHADSYVGSRVALVGDAAHVIHPQAGQGLNMGLADSEVLAQTLDYAVRHGQDVGDQLSLEQYNATQYEPNHRLLGIVDKLHKLYAYESGPLVALRSLGLEAVNAIEPLKHFLMRQASGSDR